MSRSAADIRREFIAFFEEKAHTFAPSSPVVPHDDPTLLFTNAGMNQFKDVFLGTGSRPYTRAANTQKCIRAGGKHNDLDDVGQDTYHHTFFEMLGNWSFGDYFKAEAIDWAWELLVKHWGLDPERLHATYFEGDRDEGLAPDNEARELWLRYLPAERIHPGNKKDNFWEMGDTGPCGPCSEIHHDGTPDKSGARLVNADDARVIEIWNLVFIQFNRDAAGKLTPLPAKHVDTGMGFERVTALLQGKASNYDTDVFTPLFDAIRATSRAEPYGGLLPGANAPHEKILRDTTYRVIADHLRCLTFAITDGAVPDKEGRGYVLRRILRRGVRYGWQYFNLREPFLCRLVPTLVDLMGDAFPELKQDPDRVAAVIREEEESFSRTLERGIALFDQAAAEAREHHKNRIRGEDAFKLHDTYGFPIDLTQIMAEEQGLAVDIGEYERLMDAARERARAAQGGGVALGNIQPDRVTALGVTDDTPKYANTEAGGMILGALRINEDESVDVGKDVVLQAGDRGGLVLDRTCFYAEQGGQVGDTGVIRSAHNIEFQVADTQRFGDTVLHLGTVLAGSFKAGTPVDLTVHQRRQRIRQNHTATHLLNWALREVLGDHVAQKGSLVDEEKTRFDFAHPRALNAEEAARIEQLVNEKIAADLPVRAQPVEQAKALEVAGLRAVFGEKYPDIVRVLSIGPAVDELLAQPDNPAWRAASIEFCGGTHCRNTGQIERFALTAEESVAKGVRRLVGVTESAAAEAEQTGEQLLTRARALESTDDFETLSQGTAELQQALGEQVMTLRQRFAVREAIAKLQKKAKQQQKAQAADAAGVVIERCKALADEAETVGDAKMVVAELPDVPVEQLKQGADLLKQKLGSVAVLFGVKAGAKALLVAAVTDDLVKRGVKAGDLVKEVAKVVGGGGGGAPTMAQAGGKNPEKLDDALAAGRTWLAEKLGG